MKTTRTSIIKAVKTLAAAAATCVFSTAASAHTLLVDPPPISPNDDAKAGPCGCKFGSDPACPANYTTTTYNVGDTVTIKWTETVQHNGKFRLAFSTKAPSAVTSADLDANVLYDKDDANSQSGGMITTTLTIPDAPCNPCTLQLRQFMDGAANPYYFSCASIRIVDPNATSSSSSTSGDPTGGAGGAPAGGVGPGGGDTGEDGFPDGEGGSTGPGIATPPTPIQTGGCSVGGSPEADSGHERSAPGSVGLFLAAGLALVERSKRRRRGARR
jgi:hypothetical protein